MRRRDVDGFSAWGRHTDPLLRHYEPSPLSSETADDLWRFLSGAPVLRRPFSGFLGDRFIASLIVRTLDPDDPVGDIGIMLDPALIGRGLGRRILAAFVAVLAGDGFHRLTLDVAGFNHRAIGAYVASGFAATGERWGEPEPGVDVGTLLAGPAGEILAPHVRPRPDGTYDVRVVHMERTGLLS